VSKPEKLIPILHFDDEKAFHDILIMVSHVSYHMARDGVSWEDVRRHVIDAVISSTTMAET
jgi:hypothetical protein